MLCTAHVLHLTPAQHQQVLQRLALLTQGEEKATEHLREEERGEGVTTGGGGGA